MSRALTIALFSFTFLSSYNSFAQFGSQREITQSAASARSVRAFDLDNDGDMDVLSASYDDAKVAWYENLGTGNFAKQKIISLETDGAMSVYATDLDGDGEKDVLSASAEDDKVAWYKNLGNGEFGPQQIVTTSAIGATCVYAADLDNDGDQDIISGSFGDSKIAWYENLGGGTFGPQQVIVSSIGYIYSVYPYDIDNDGDMDLFFGGSSQVSWCENMGGGSFGSAQVVSSAVSAVASVYLMDLDNDGDDDLLSASFGDDKVAWYRNLGNGTFGTQQVISNSANGAFSVYTADVDNDGDQDVLSASKDDDKVAWYVNDGAGNFSSEQLLTSTDGGAISVFSADLNSDNFVDVLTASKDDDHIYWYPNNAGAGFNAAQELSANAENVTRIFATDVDNDGDQDVLSASTFDHKIAWYENLGGNDFARQVLIDGNADGAISVHAADLDNDGDQDVLSASNNSGEFYWYENLGSGLFGLPQLIFNSSLNARYINTEDFNNDGDIDVICTISGGADSLIWFENLGGGSFGPEQLITTATGGSSFVHTADVDADGFKDIILPALTDDKIVWFQNLGNGSFGGEQVISTTVDNPNYISTADIDNDGDLDLFASSYWDGKVAWYENLGGSFGAENVITIGAMRPQTVIPADIDGDGDFDVFSNLVNAVVWHENTGAGSFGPAIEISNLPINVTDIFATDINNDGSVDLVSSSRVDNEVAWYENHFNSAFQLKGTAFYDANQNGDLDTNEIGLSFIETESSPNGMVNFSSYAGHYFHAVDTGTYIVEYIPDNLWTLTTDSASYTRTLSYTNPMEDSLDFGFYPDTILTNLNADLTGATSRCNTIVNYWANIQNLGTTTPDGLVHLILDDSISFVSADITPDSIVGQNIYWSFDSLFFYNSESFNLLVQMPSFMNLGQTMTSVLYVHELDGSNTITYTNVDSLEQLLTCAYDPNDKTVTPVGMGTEGFITVDQKLEYLIRFQNTGNDTAQVVTIRDQIDPNLDLSTLQIIASSHPMVSWIESGDVLVFNFDDIQLPDSNVNETASHGFVKFSIYPNQAALPGTEISNSGDIYFDLNPAIVTNSTLNTIYECAAPSLTISSDTICFGSSLQASITLDSYSIYDWSIDTTTLSNQNTLNWLGDSSGVFEIVSSVSNQLCAFMDTISITVLPEVAMTSQSQTVCQGDSVLVFGEYEFLQGVYYDTLQSITGCDSISAFTLNVNPTALLAENQSICQGDSIMIYGNYQSNAGVYYDTLQTIMGCDSILSTVLEVNPILSTVQSQTICQGDSILIFGNYESSIGVYYDTLQSSMGCDSIASIELDVHALPVLSVSGAQFDTLCISEGIQQLPVVNPSGGTFAGVGVVGDQFDPMVADTGLAIISYSFTDSVGCSSTIQLEWYVDGCAGVKDLEEGGRVKIFPNPSFNKVTIDFGEVGNYHVEVFDLYERRVLSDEIILSTSYSIDKSSIGSGLYTVVVESENGKVNCVLKMMFL